MSDRHQLWKPPKACPVGVVIDGRRHACVLPAGHNPDVPDDEREHFDAKYVWNSNGEYRTAS